MITCENCKGKGMIETTEEKLEKVLTSKLYDTAKAKKHSYDGYYIVYFGRHTDMNGGQDGDIITNREIEQFRNLGYEIRSISKTYVYLHPTGSI